MSVPVKTIICKRCDKANEVGYDRCSCCAMTDAEAERWYAEYGQLPQDDIFDEAEHGPLPADHADKCFAIAQDMAKMEKLMYRLGNGDIDAAVKLESFWSRLGDAEVILHWNATRLVASVLNG